jgi:hypothetical protein
MMMKSWILEVEELPDGEKFISLNDEILAETGWKEGTVIEWIDNHDGSWTMQEKEETELVMVDCISQFRQRYLVEVPKGKTEWALDTVTMNEAKEFSQEHIGEVIVSHRIVSQEEALKICDIDNNYCSGWSEQQKIDAFFTLRKDYE